MLAYGVLLAVTLGLSSVGVVSMLQAGRAWPPAIVAQGVFVSLFTWRLIVAVRRRADPARHPMVRQLARFGDPLEVARALDAEVTAASARRAGDVIITRRFLVDLDGPDVVGLDEIAWVYPKITRRSVNFIPLGESASLELHTFGPPHAILPLSLRGGAALNAALVERAPRARFGYSLELAAWWKDARLRGAP